MTCHTKQDRRTLPSCAIDQRIGVREAFHEQLVYDDAKEWVDMASGRYQKRMLWWMWACIIINIAVILSYWWWQP